MTSASRVRLAAACLLIIGLALVQDPGFLVPDTKFDLVMNPVDFLGRALHLWDAEGAFGQLQNQAYGYLWPMGPFFVLGDLAQLPGWLVQRLWLGLVMAVALSGAVKVARALGVRSDLACLTAGFAFALSPRMLTTLGPISIEAWPSAMAPWVLLPLIHGSRAGSPRRWAALAGLAVAMVGGVNAAATFAVIPLGVIWLLTRTPGPRRRSLMLWWPLFTLLGTSWWLVPLFVMGSYSPPFLDFIETTSVTTFPTTLFDVLRGTSNWVPYVDASSRAGNDLITTSYLVLNSGVVLMVGFAGLSDRRTRERAFLSLSVLLGVLMVAAGHAGAVEGWFAGDIRSLLDGVLSPLRNVHKFDVVLRLPLVLGLAFVLDRVVGSDATDNPADESRGRSLGPSVLSRGNQVTVAGMVLLAVAGSMVPAMTGRITPAGATLDVPQYWRQTADWLADHDDGTALVLPGASFASYVWGSPRDEPLQFFADSPWAVRNVIPLTPPANIRMLDEIERRIAQGEGSPGFAAYLRRAGVRHVVVRNDLQPGDDVPVPVVVHQVLAESGLARVASFGPDVGGGATLRSPGGDRIVVNGGWQAVYPAVEVFEVPGDAGGRAATAGQPPIVVGGPEDLVDLLDEGMLGDSPVRLAADLDAEELETDPQVPVILTDGLRARERFFPRIHDGYSPAVTPGDVRRSGNPSRDYLSEGGDRWSTTVRLAGAAAVSASSSGSDPGALGGARRGELPFAALDGAATTEWLSGLGQDEVAWWQVTFDGPASPTTVSLTGGASAPENQVVRVATEAGATDPVEVGPGQRVRVDLPPGPTTWLRVDDDSGAPGRQVALAEVAVPGITVDRQLVTPALPEGWTAPDAVVLRADLDGRTGCVEVSGDVRCVESRARAHEEAAGMTRVVTLPSAATYEPRLRVRPRASRALTRIIQGGQPVRVAASSTAVPDPRAGPLAAIDGDPGTSWTAAADDIRPTLGLRWLGEQTITGIDLELSEATAARLPSRLRLTWPGGSRIVELTDGEADFGPVRTDQLQVRVEQADFTSDLGFDARPARIGIGIGELELEGLPYLPLGLSADVRRTGCGAGPDVTVNGTEYSTYVEASPAALQRGIAVPAGLCDPRARAPREDPTGELAMTSGENVVRALASRAFLPDSLVLSRTDGRVAASAPASARVTGSAVRRMIDPGRGDDTVLQLRQNDNPGWTARQDGRVLAPVVLDGWQQGWILDGDGQVTAEFGPDRPYRAGLLAGLAACLVLVLLTIVSLLRRRRVADEPPALTEHRLSVWIATPAALVGSGLVAGWAGVGIAAGTALVAAWWSGRWPLAAPWVLAAPCFAAAAAYAVTPWGSSSGWAGQSAWTAYVMLVPLVALLVAATPAAGSRRLQRLFSRRAGRSTSR